ncbi:restriction endonuclease subunit S [Enterococcus faecium]|uniref:restriction endonuclease subunit S n=1 Tax=Enterococcus faecium TaxID=1352 RepID=UPI00296AD99E|nr:restriction endonuclease subunit S [Enterococcus faecium]
MEWIGGIPESWELVKIGQHFKQRNEKVSDLDFKPLSVTKNGIVPQLDNAAKSSNHNDRKLVKKGDFVINSRSDRKQSSGIAYEDGSVSLINLVIKSRTVDTNFTNYLLKNAGFAEEFYRWGNGIVADLWSTKWDSMKRIPIPLPELAEQKKVANVIRDKVKIIDTIISETQQSIDELKKYKQALITETVTKGLDKNVEMKDSGIDILPSIPTSWKIQKIKNLFSMNKGLSITKENLEDNGIPVISYGEIHSKYGFNFDPTKDFVRNVPESFVQSDKQAILHKGDFVFADTSEDIEGSGNFTCFTGNVTTFAGYHTVILKAKANFNHQYVAYLFDSKIFRSQIQKNVQGIKVFSITQRILKDQWIWLPPIEVQENIVSFLDKKRIIINQMIDNKIAELMELESYKKALIYEYVTGKKEA